MINFRAFVVNKTDQDFTAGVKELSPDDLMPGEVTIQVAYSSVNYKDGLAARPDGRVARVYPLIPGVDLAGTVSESRDSRFAEGSEVLVTGYDLGVAHHGGFSQVARVPADWVVPLPKGLSAREAMALGTAGFTAALSIHKLEHNGLKPGQGPVLVTGATGGVGSTAVGMLAQLGYEVVASSGKVEAADFLKRLGASAVIAREETANSKRPLDKERWAGAVDPVGGQTLAYILSTLRYGCAVASSGLTGGNDLSTTVFPFVLRGVSLLGIDSVFCPMDLRRTLWERLAGDLKPRGLGDEIAHEITLEELPRSLDAILKGEMTGRAVVRPA